MARPREFEESALLEAATSRFWSHGYAATSIKDLVNITGVTAASLYNAYGDKRGFFQAVLEHYIESRIATRMRRFAQLPPREGIEAFFAEIVRHSLKDPEHKGCLLVNSALEIAPHDQEFKIVIAGGLHRLEMFFRGRIERGQAIGAIARTMSPQTLGKHLLGVLLAVSVLARVAPEKKLMEGMIAPALALLENEPE